MRERTRLMVLVASAVLWSAFAAGCATVQPWERRELANPCMIFDSNGAQAAYDAHWQTAREGSAGGFGFQGGGCGCK